MMWAFLATLVSKKCHNRKTSQDDHLGREKLFCRRLRTRLTILEDETQSEVNISAYFRGASSKFIPTAADVNIVPLASFQVIVRVAAFRSFSLPQLEDTEVE